MNKLRERLSLFQPTLHQGAYAIIAKGKQDEIQAIKISEDYYRAGSK